MNKQDVKQVVCVMSKIDKINRLVIWLIIFNFGVICGMLLEQKHQTVKTANQILAETKLEQKVQDNKLIIEQSMAKLRQ